MITLGTIWLDGVIALAIGSGAERQSFAFADNAVDEPECFMWQKNGSPLYVPQWAV